MKTTLEELKIILQGATITNRLADFTGWDVYADCLGHIRELEQENTRLRLHIISEASAIKDGKND